MDIYNLLKEKNISIQRDNSYGISLDYNNNEIIIKGSSIDLIELANYLVNVALSNNKNDHLHLDNLTLINDNSHIKDLIIEKE